MVICQEPAKCSPQGPKGNWGARNLLRIRSGVESAMKLAAMVSVSISIVTLLSGRYLLMMFISSSDANAPRVLAYQYLAIMSITLVILYALHIYRSALQGMGNTVIPMIAGLLECVGRVSVALLLPRILGEFGLFFSESTAWLFSAVCVMSAYYASVRRAPDWDGERIL